MANNGRPGAIRKLKKGPTTGTGGHGRKALEGKGPTPKAEDRPYHKAYKNKQLVRALRGQACGGGGRSAGARSGPKGRATEEVVTGRNSVVEALRAGIPAKALHVAIRIEMDDRVKESLKLAAERGIPLLETGKPELDRMTDDAVHQGLVLQIPPYEYQDAYDLAEADRGPAGRRGTSRTRPSSSPSTASRTPATSARSSAPSRPSAATASSSRNAVPWVSRPPPGRPAPARPSACPWPARPT